MQKVTAFFLKENTFIEIGYLDQLVSNLCNFISHKSTQLTFVKYQVA